MANERHRRLMQDALDERLSAEMRHELYEQLDRSPDDAAEFNRLRQVDRLLRSAPMERAPGRLALSIMAKLAEGLQPQQLTRASGLAFALALSLVTLALLPLLAGLGWLLLNALGSASALTSALESMMGLLTSLLSSVETVIQAARDVLATYPETPVLMLTIIPLSAFWLARTARLRAARSRLESEE